MTNPVAIQLCETDIVNSLLIRPFSVRPPAEQNVIVNERPTPNLTIKNKGRSFMKEWYCKKDWLCGSSILENCPVGLVFCFVRELHQRGQRLATPTQEV